MHRNPDSIVHSLTLMMITGAIVLLGNPGAAGAQLGWPREIDVPEGKITIYQPQLESFKGNQLQARAAVSVIPKGKIEPVFGAVWFDARVSTDRDTRMVTCEEINIPTAKFPNATPEQLEKLASILKREMPKWDMSISLDRLLTMLELAERQKTPADALGTDPPNIRFVNHPVELVTIDGAPQFRPVENTSLMQIINTPYFLVLESNSKAYYLNGPEIGWLTAFDVAGPWKTASDIPKAVSAYAEKELADEGGVVSQPSRKMPQVVLVTETTELITFDGKPKYTPIVGTDLLFASNTTYNVFMEIATQRYYVELSGRWYTSDSLKDAATWTYVRPDKLPADFGNIPSDSPKGDVLSHVSGTIEAKEAVLDTEIPQTTAIQRDQTITVTYDGKPKFKKIKDTKLAYANNTNYQVIRANKKYYCCHEAVWYVADDPLGPWEVCVILPQEIYTLPPTSPVYHVKYVRIYKYTDTVVYVGYTPGYVGTYVNHGTVVYGTGYVYPAYVSATVYYPHPVTFGFHFHFGRYSGGWWGHGGGYKNKYYRNVNIDNSRNIYAGRLPSRPGGRPGRPGDRPDRPGRPGDRPGRPAQQPARPVARDRSGRPNNVFADKRGNVHRRGQDGKWQQKTGSGWKSPGPSPSLRRSRTQQNLSRQHNARQRGTRRTNQYQRSRRSAPRGQPSRSPRRGGGGRSRGRR